MVSWWAGLTHSPGWAGRWQGSGGNRITHLSPCHGPAWLGPWVVVAGLPRAARTRPFALARLVEASIMAKSRVIGRGRPQAEGPGRRAPRLGLVQPRLQLGSPSCWSSSAIITGTSGGARWGFTLLGVTGSVVQLAGVINILTLFLNNFTRALLRSSLPPALLPSLVMEPGQRRVKSVPWRSRATGTSHRVLLL